MNTSKPSSSLADIVPPGVVTGDKLLALLEHARVNKYAIPAVNVTRYVVSRIIMHCNTAGGYTLFDFPDS